MDVRPDCGILSAIHEVALNKQTIISKSAEEAYKNILKDLLEKVTTTENCYSFIIFFAGVFLPKESSK